MRLIGPVHCRRILRAWVSCGGYVALFDRMAGTPIAPHAMWPIEHEPMCGRAIITQPANHPPTSPLRPGTCITCTWVDENVLYLLFLGVRAYSTQMLAALQYSRDTPGVWFFNPQAWVSHNLFKTASIWEIPLVKPRFTCEIYPLTSVENAAVAGILQRSLDFFAMGGACENGLISHEP